MEFNFLQRPRLDFHQDGIVSLQLRRQDQVQEQEEEARVEIKENEEEEECTVSCAESSRPVESLREFKSTNDRYEDDDVVVVDDDDDGFKTPTSLDHKIPVIKQCPPAPKKPKILSTRKRKNARRNLRLDLHEEVESLFPSNILADLYNKIKKARKDEDTNDTTTTTPVNSSMICKN